MPETQPYLFTIDAHGGTTPAARATDPATSHDAAANHTESGARAKHAAIVLAIVRRHPGSTYTELFEYTTAGEKEELKDKYEVMRRLNDLAKALPAAVVKADIRRCLVQKTPMTTWVDVGN